MIREMRTIRFKFAAKKAAAAVLWMVDEKPGIDLHSLLKACYFADKWHLNRHRRPVFGATYKAMKFGPVPLEIYEMAKGEMYYLPEIGATEYPWRISGYSLHRSGNAHPDLEELSDSDFRAIERGLRKSVSMNFDERTAATHGPDWQAAELGYMRYEDMIDEDKREALVPYLAENARFMRL
nr:Panacea domain-containing protein [Methylobacterium sp. ZNC0032]